MRSWSMYKLTPTTSPEGMLTGDINGIYTGSPLILINLELKYSMSIR